ncbi:MAG: hypothetical protein IT456_28130 [Planctomycetes bacterium]|nr:hypothetical protein [Planctomycetota bacterium]
MTTSDPARAALVTRLRQLVGGWPDDLLDLRRPAFLSRRQPSGETAWYAMAHSPRQARELREHLLAFVGVAYSNFAGQAADWDPSDSFEAELAAAFPHSFRVTVPATAADVAASLLTRLRQMLSERPLRDLEEPQPLGRLLRDFELLVRACDWRAASVLLDRLRERGQLTADQLAGLRLRLLAGQGRWEEVLAAPELPALVAQRLPVSVSEAVAAAVYHEYLARFATDAEAAAHFREHIAPTYGLVFRQRAAWRQQDALKASAIVEASFRLSPPRDPVSVAPADSLSTAVAAHNAGDGETALRLLLAGPLTAEWLRHLVEVALDLGTRDAACSALAAIRACDAAVWERAFSRRASKALLEELEAVAGEVEAGAPSEWIAWLARATNGAWPDAAAVARRGLAEWSRPDPAQLNDALLRDAVGAFPAIREALPSLLGLILPSGKPDAQLGPAYLLLLEQFVLDDRLSPSPASTSVVEELAAAVLRSCPVANSNRNDYAQVVQCLELAWDCLKRPVLLDWGLGLLDLAAEHAVHRHTNVARLAQAVAGEFVRVPRLVTSGQRSLLRSVCAELEAPAAAEIVSDPVEPGVTAPGVDAESLRKKLGRRSVLLLTMSDRTASAFLQLMKEHYPDARPEVLREHAGTKRLRDAAKGAEVFIVNTYDTKHAATTFVTQHRPADMPTLYPKGKNAARQLDVLEDWLRSPTGP